MLGLISAVFEAATMVLAPRFVAADTVSLLRRHRPTIFPVVPAICEAISNELERELAAAAKKDSDVRNGNGATSAAGSRAARIEGLRLCISGAAPLTRAVAERFERLTGSRVIEGYGLSEASPVTHANLPGKPRFGSIGPPLPDTRCRIVEIDDPTRDVPIGEPGELLISGPQVMTGYFASRGDTERVLIKDADGATWLRTGDVMCMDEDGFFYVLDRTKDMIIRSGLKVYPAKVERILAGHEAVADAAVIGRPDEIHTEVVTAVIVPKDAEANREALIEALKAECREHLAPYEVPMRFEFVEKIPRSLLGKALKKELRRTTTTSIVLSSPAPEQIKAREMV
jgi:long-chain acyl-CoA synthetase